MKCKFIMSLFELFKIITFLPCIVVLALVGFPYWIITGNNVLDKYGSFLIKETNCDGDKK